VGAAPRAAALACVAALTACGPTSVGPRSSEVACQRGARALMRLGISAQVAPSSDGGYQVQVASKDAGRSEAALTALGLPEPPTPAARWLRGPGELAAARAQGRVTEAARRLEAYEGVLSARIVASTSGASVQVVTLPGLAAGAMWPDEVASWLAPSLGLPEAAVRVALIEFTPPAQTDTDTAKGHAGLVKLLAFAVLVLSFALLVVQRKAARSVAQ